MIYDPKNMTKGEALHLLKSIDRKLKNVTSDSEISGRPNYDLLPPDLLPLMITGDDADNNLTLLGGLTAGAIASIQDSWEKEQLDKTKRYEKLKSAQEHPEIDGCLNIYADEATTEDQNGIIIHISHPNQEVKEVCEDMLERIGMDDKSWQILRNMSGYGEDFHEIVVSRSGRAIVQLNRLPREIISRIEENGILKGFRIDNSLLVNKDQQFIYQMNYKSDNEKDKDLIYPFRILHFRIPSDKYGVYGQAVIDTVVSTIEQLKLMEKALVVARVTRAPERRVYTVDVGGLQGEKAIKYARDVINSFKSKKNVKFFEGDTKIGTDTQKDIFGATEDIVIPKRAGSEGNTITTLEQANSLGDIADIEFLRDKIFPAIGIPRQYFYDDTFANSNTNLSSKSVPFAKKIKRLQRFFLQQIYKLCIIELKLKQYSNEDISMLEIYMNNPSNIDDRERISVESERWGLISTIKGLNSESVFYPDFLIYQNFLNLDNEEIVTLLKLSYMQQNGINPFQAVDEEERPEGAEELQVGAGTGGAEGGMGGGGMGGGGALPGLDMGAGGLGAEGGEEGGMEGGEATEGGAEPEIPETESEAIPQEITEKLGPPPKPETADVNPKVGVKIYDENKLKEMKRKKEEVLQAIKLYEESASILNNKKENEEVSYEKYMKRTKRVAFTEMFISGQLDGLHNIYKHVKEDTDEEIEIYYE